MKKKAPRFLIVHRSDVDAAGTYTILDLMRYDVATVEKLDGDLVAFRKDEEGRLFTLRRWESHGVRVVAEGTDYHEAREEARRVVAAASVPAESR